MQRKNQLEVKGMRCAGRFARAALAVIVAFSLAMPAPALAWAEGDLAAGVPSGGIRAAGIAGGQTEGAAAANDAIVAVDGGAAAGKADGGMFPAIAADVWDGTVDTAWYASDPAASQFTVSTPAELAGLAAIVNGTAKLNGTPTAIARDDFSGKTVTLSGDVWLNGEEAYRQDDDQEKWTPIGDRPLIGTHNGNQPLFDEPHAFKGVFDGQGHKVVNIYACTAGETNKWGVSDYGGYQGLFGALGEGAVVKNLGIEGGFVTGRAAGGVAALGASSAVAEKPMIVNCYNTATIEGNGSSSRGAGGIFGGEGSPAGSEGDYSSCYIANCYNAGDVEGKSNNRSAPLGGIAGQGSVEVYSCYNAGLVASSSSNVRGAIVGTCRAGSVVGDCYGLEGRSDALYNVEGTPAAAVAEGLVSASGLRALADEGKLSAAFAGAGTAFPRLFWESGSCETVDVGELVELGPVEDQDYTGEALTPAVAVVLGGTSLKAGSDYRVVYSDNVDVGKATFAITFIGVYSGSTDGHFKIVGTSLDRATVEVAPQWIYGSDPVEPDIVVKDVTGKTLKAKVDYRATFTDNTSAGTGHVRVEPGSNGNYKGSIVADFPIVAASTSLDGAGTEASPYLVGSRADFQLLAHKVNDLPDEVTGVYKLTADIDMAGSDDEPEVDVLDAYYERMVQDGYYWYEVKNAFAGTLDGGGHTLFMDFETEASSFGLFGHNLDDTDVTVRDLNLEGSIVAPYTAAVLFPSVYGNLTLENVRSSVNVTGGYRAYGLVGENWARGSVVIRDCENAGAVHGGREAAGIVGVAHLGSNLGAFKVSDTVNSGTVSAGNDDYTGQWAGGIVGSTAQFSSSIDLLQLERCANTGSISADGTAGGLVAKLGESGSSLSTGDPSVNWHPIIACFNTGAVTAGSAAGGLVGAMRDENRLRLSGVYNTGDVAATGESGVAGGLVGGIGSGGWYLDVSGAYNAGAVTSAAADSAGALLGHASVGSMYYPAGAEITLSGAYYLSGSAASWAGSLAEDEKEGYFPRKGPKVNGEAAAMSAADMKSIGAQGLASKLGNQFTHDARKVNQGYPVLFWQMGGVVVLDITGGEVSVIPDQEYTGRAIAPTGIVVKLADGTLLEQGSDFITSFANNVHVGTAVVTLTGIGRCVGALETSFNIVKADVSGFSIDGIVPQWGSAASPAEPAVTLRDRAGWSVGFADGFTVSYEGNRDEGWATVKVSADADNESYSGVASARYRVYLLAADMAGGAGTEDDPYLVGSASELELMARGINAGTLPANGFYRLSENFTIPADVAMTAIGSAAHPFAGTFDGAGKAITRRDTLASGYALLHDVDGATVRGLTIAGTVIARHLYDPVAFQVNEGGTFAGAIDGDVTFSGCRNEARVRAVDAKNSTLEGLGGFAASVGADCVVRFIGCENAGAVANRCTIAESARAGTGGFVGCFASQTLSKTQPTRLSFENCVNSGSVTVDSASYAAGFVGKLNSDGYDENAEVSFKNCLNEAPVSAPSGSSQAGIVGGGTSGGDSDNPGTRPVVVRMDSVGNRGAISGFDGSAGLFGVASGISLDAHGIYNTGSVSISTDIESGTQIAGGLVTVITDSSTAPASLSIEDAYNAGALRCADDSDTADPLFGGVAGGVVSGEEHAFDNVFYTLESAEQGIGNAQAEEGAEFAADPDGIAPVFEADLRESAFIGELGGAFISDDDNENGGLPVCTASKIDIGDYHASFKGAGDSTSPMFSVPYSGEAVAPEVVVSPDSTGAEALVAGSDYLVFYHDNVDAGTAGVTIVGAGAYRGSLELPFSIVGAGGISDCTVSAIPGQFYTGKALEPGFTVTCANDAGTVTLERGVDYAATFLNNVNEGTAAVLIKGMGAWSGSRVVKFNICKPYLTVKLRTGSGAAKVVKRYSRAGFEALGRDGEAVSALYRTGTGVDAWRVATSGTYVALDSLLVDAGVPWKAGASVTCTGSSGSGTASATFTYSDLHARFFYPAATAGDASSAAATAGARKTPAVLAIDEASSAIGEDGGSSAIEAEKRNLSAASTDNGLRFLLGVTAQEAAKRTAGESRLVGGVNEVTVTILDFKTLANALASAAKAESGVRTSSRKGSDVLVTAKWVTPTAKKALDEAIAAGKAVKSSATAVQVDIDSATAAVKKALNAFKPAAGKKKLVNPLTVKTKSPSVRQSKKKDQSVAAKSALAVSGAKGAVTYERVAKGSSKWLAVNSKTGAVTVKKGAPKKTLAVNVKVKAAGNATYAAGSKTVKVKVKVK